MACEGGDSAVNAEGTNAPPESGMTGEEIEAAVEVLRRGGVVAFPTETVYGLGADATQAQAVRSVFRIKGRPATNPLIGHVADREIAKRYAAVWPDAAERLARRFWPGALTLVLPKHSSIADEATAGLKTVGLRVPDHPLALVLLRQFGGVVAAPSANLSNQISPTTAEHVRQQLGGEIKIILDGGPCRVGIESTVLDLSGERPVILRPGGVSRTQIESEIGPVELDSASASKGEASRSPGQHPIHYAPRAPAYRFDNFQQSAMISRLGKEEVVIAIAPSLPLPSDSGQVHWMPNEPDEYARQLYALLWKLDQTHPRTIFIEMPPHMPEWLAVRDRLMRATRPLKG
jgi:L-threonylcarbamoyladenylate synthase